eukprot:CAMPEP_0114571142 /NCGR_PEP_ID=MMETSP0114-20121206/17591_1 /TAXON_ID=31324 /ORGANISM="Goniomonas sp, Strain m" /LENGTH=154 /DNA_ID=CAMNT_0001758247 /DNA_START=596 /DNA_END=1060 /DNA_ORIENTATION=+
MNIAPSKQDWITPSSMILGSDLKALAAFVRALSSEAAAPSVPLFSVQVEAMKAIIKIRMTMAKSNGATRPKTVGHLTGHNGNNAVAKDRHAEDLAQPLGREESLIVFGDKPGLERRKQQRRCDTTKQPSNKEDPETGKMLRDARAPVQDAIEDA